MISDSYIQAVNGLAANNEAAQQQAQTFIDSHNDAYASLLSLQLAKSYVESDELNKAAALLREVQTNKDQILATIATLRLARVEIELTNYDAALAELNKVTATSWKAQMEELRGDAEQHKGNLVAARSAYMASILAEDNPLVKMKLDNLPHQG